MAAAPSVCLDLVRDVLRILLTNPGGNGKELIIDVFRRLRDSNRCAVYDIDDEEDLELRLEKYPEVFRFHGRGRDIAVSPNINLSICPTHSYKVGSCKEQTCAALHLCMFFLLSGKCAFKDRCLFGHDLNTDHNRRRLQDHLLGGLNMTELRTLFCLPWVRRGVTVPRVCRYYNQQVGCAKGQSCRSLHMCRMYVLQRCKFGKGCARNHDVNHPLVKDVLTLYGVNVTGRPLKDILDEVRTYERPDTGADSEDADDKEATSGVAVGAGARPQRFASTPNLFQTGKLSLTPQAEGSSQRCPSASRRQRNCSESSYGALSRDGGAKQKMEELCRFQFTETGCRFGERCRCLHGSDPFLWRFTVWDENEAGQEVTWRSLDPTNNLHLERDYCQPHVIESTVTDIDGTKMKVDLKHFTAVNSGDKMRYRAVRLSTPSSMETSTRSSDGHHSTVWLWYWRGRNGQWNEFGLEREGFERLPLRSNTVERNFLASHNTPLNIGHFVLDFNKMRLKDLATHNKFKVRRRPQFQLRNNESEPEDGSRSLSFSRHPASGMSMRTRENQQNRGSQLRHHGLYDGPHCMTPPRGPPPFQWHYSAGPPMPPFPYPFPWHFNPYNPWPPHHSYVQQPRSQSQ